MFSTVEKIILVKKFFTFPKVEISQLNLIRIVGKTHSAGVVIAVILAVNEKPVKIPVIPIKSDLQNKMQVGNRIIIRHQKPSPDQRADAFKRATRN
jgi:hypothetical protein